MQYRFHRVKDIFDAYRSVDPTNKAVEDIYLLLSNSILGLDCCVDDNLFNQRVQ